MDFIEDTDNDIIRLRTKIKISEFIINISKNKNDNDIYNIIVNNADIYNDIIYVSGLMVIENDFEADDDIRDYIIIKFYGIIANQVILYFILLIVLKNLEKKWKNYIISKISNIN